MHIVFPCNIWLATHSMAEVIDRIHRCDGRLIGRFSADCLTTVTMQLPSFLVVNRRFVRSGQDLSAPPAWEANISRLEYAKDSSQAGEGVSTKRPPIPSAPKGALMAC